MIGISKLYCGTVESSDVIRYGGVSSKLPSDLLQFSFDKIPVIVWNVTKKCNLKCMHCYARSTCNEDYYEMSTGEGKSLIDDLANYGTPVILFSGGEPLLRKDILDLAYYSVKKGLRAVLSTNGTLIDKSLASELKNIGLSYIGISLDGMEKVNDEFRGVPGAFSKAIEGIKNCLSAGIKVGIRFTITKYNMLEIESIFELLVSMSISRICFYHLVYSGRGSDLIGNSLSHAETRKTVELIMNRTKFLHKSGEGKEVLTVDNHADGPFLYIKLLKENPKRAAKVIELLNMNGGNNSGVGIGCVNWDGEVYADQFLRHYSFGNVRAELFSKIWTNTKNHFLLKLKNKKKYIEGRCKFCRWLNICGGNFRARAESVTGNVWASDPACYLTDKEIF